MNIIRPDGTWRGNTSVKNTPARRKGQEIRRSASTVAKARGETERGKKKKAGRQFTCVKGRGVRGSPWSLLTLWYLCILTKRMSKGKNIARRNLSNPSRIYSVVESRKGLFKRVLYGPQETRECTSNPYFCFRARHVSLHTTPRFLSRKKDFSSLGPSEMRVTLRGSIFLLCDSRTANNKHRYLRRVQHSVYYIFRGWISSIRIIKCWV